MKIKAKERHLSAYIKVFQWLKKLSQREGLFVIAVRQLAVMQDTITMPHKMTNANNALDILCVTLPLNKHSNKRVSQQRVVV